MVGQGKLCCGDALFISDAVGGIHAVKTLHLYTNGTDSVEGIAWVVVLAETWSADMRWNFLRVVFFWPGRFGTAL